MDCKNGAAAHSIYCCHVSERLPIKVNKKIGEFLHLKKNFFLRLTRIIAQYFTLAGASQLTVPPRAPMV